MSVLIQGASRGIGLELTKHLLRKSTLRIFASCRNPSQAQNLQALKTTTDRLELLQIDITDENTIAGSVEDFQRFQAPSIDMVFNVAGILHPTGQAERSITLTTQEDLEKIFLVNSIGPTLLAKHFYPQLSKESKWVNFSARVGSIGDNKLGGWYGYRMSKAALNQLTKTLSNEWKRKGCTVISMHPGTVDTDFTKPYQKNIKNLFTTEYAVDEIMKVVDGLTINETGKFFDYSGTEVVW